MLHNSINVEVILTILLLWFLNNITNYPVTTRIVLALTARKPVSTYYQILISEPSETFRSMIFLFLSLLKCSEAWNFIFWAFWNVQKHEFLFFELSETFRSVNFLFFEPSEMFRSVNFHFLSLLKCSEAWFSDFRSFWNVQKWVNYINDYIKLGKSTLSMRRKALYLLYKAFQTTK